MTYRLDSGLFVENGPALRAADTVSARQSARFRSWRKLSPDRRLDLVERSLNMPANDVIDQFPVAL